MKKRKERSSSAVQVSHDDLNLVDRISDLPDEILRHILCFLPTNIAFTTSVLSKRWTKLCYLLPVLRFEDINDHHRFCRIVNSVMLSRVTNQPLKIFSLNCRFKERKRNSSFNLKKWLEATKQHCIEEFHLNLHFHHTLKPVVFISQTFVVLKLQRLDIEKDTSCVDLPSLKTLSLEYVSFENWNDYINFLYGCPILEDLQVDDISIRTLPKHYENNVPERGFKSLTLAKLVRASIDSKDAHFNGIDNVKFLRIIKGYGSKEESFEFIPVFSNLIHIELVFWYHSIHSWDGVVELLRHSPRLQILYIKKWRKTRSSKEWKYPISNLEGVSSHLRSCTILNFDNSANDLRFAKYILQNAHILQDMKIGFVIKSLNEILLEKGQIKEELSSFSRISPGCKLSFEFKFIY